MQRWSTSLLKPNAREQMPFGARRDRFAMLLALVAAMALGAGFVLSKGSRFLMPGPLASAHGAIENCKSCHTQSGDGKLTWLHGLMAGDRRADSKACLACHKMSDTAFNAHGASRDVLKQSTERLSKIAASTPVPLAARAESAASPAHEIAEGQLACATCHQEHKGANVNLARISNEQCRSCHVVKFDSFDGHHPKFETYPFVQRTRLIYDHAGHFGKHYPELAKKDPAKSIPETCSTCHNSNDNKLIMAVAPFEKTCSGCHLDQIVGKARATGPKGIAFLSLPGLDVQTLRRRKAAIGEWPDGSDAELTPFMKVMMSRSKEGRDLLRIIDGLDLKDLASASDEQIKAVTRLVMEVKRLVHALISGKASDVLGDLNIVSGARLSANLVADLTANIPRDVIASAQKEWLPVLASEIANGVSVQDVQPAAANVSRDNENPGTAPAPESADLPKPDAKSASSASAEDAARAPKRDPPPCLVHLFGQCMVYKDAPPPQPDGAAATNVDPESSGGAAPANALPAPMRAGLKGVDGNAGQSQPEGATPATKTGEQVDDLLNPTEDELRAMRDHANTSGKAAAGGAAAEAAEDNNPSTPARAEQTAAPVISIESSVDPESWAEYGGWYRQDYTIFYRPAGHKDKFLYSWLFLTGPQAPRDDKSPAAAVFDALTSKDAQGSCSKCHSIDDLPGKGRIVNFSPMSAQSKLGSFTRFVHEPHFGILETRGCMTCHELAKDRPYLKSFEQGDPRNFASNFNPAKKELCQTCHSSGKARQDCLLCHNYHVNGANTPIMRTRIPSD